MTSPTHIRASDPNDDNITVDAIEQHVWRACHGQTGDRCSSTAGRWPRARDHLCRTKRTAQKLSDDLADRGFAVGAVHGDLGQGAREQALRAFRSGKIDVLVATDVAARGIDVEGVTHVMNYACPEDEKTYLHRIGRTGRAGASGVAVTLVDWDDVPRWTLINKALGLAFAEPVETYSTSDHVYTGLGIPRPSPANSRALIALGQGWRPKRSKTSEKPALPRVSGRRAETAVVAGILGAARAARSSPAAVHPDDQGRQARLRFGRR